MIISPCISICKTDPKTGFCYGCGRNNSEKINWKLGKKHHFNCKFYLPRDYNGEKKYISNECIGKVKNCQHFLCCPSPKETLILKCGLINQNVQKSQF